MADYSLVKAMLCSELKSLVSNNTQSNSYGYSYTIVSLLDEYFIFLRKNYFRRASIIILIISLDILFGNYLISNY
jgi:hypothetical protein